MKQINISCIDIITDEIPSNDEANRRKEVDILIIKLNENIPANKTVLYEANINSEIRSYIEKTVEGEEDILWPGKPIYFSKTSGTTSGAKYIPITKESMPTHINAALDALLTYINYTGKADFVLGKQIFIQGSPELDQKNGISLGRLSGIVAHYVPSILENLECQVGKQTA